MNQLLEYSSEQIAEAIRHSYTGEIDDDTLQVKDVYGDIGHSSLATEVIWKQ